MKKLTAILLLLFLCFTLLGYHFIFNYQLQSVKAEMRAYLKGQKEHKDVMQLSLNEKEVEQTYWENDHEFRFKGQMYDVIEAKKIGGLVVVRCIPDNKETSLLNEYQKNNRRNTSNSTIIQLITTHYDLPADNLLCQPQRMVKKYYNNYSSSLSTVASTILLPPPDVC